MTTETASIAQKSELSAQRERLPVVTKNFWRFLGSSSLEERKRKRWVIVIRTGAKGVTIRRRINRPPRRNWGVAS